MKDCLTFGLTVLLFISYYHINVSSVKAIGAQLEIKKLKHWTEISLLNRI